MATYPYDLTSFLTNPNAETGDLTGWTVWVGTCTARTQAAASGTYGFSGSSSGSAARDAVYQEITGFSDIHTDIDNGDLQIELAWSQGAFAAGNDPCSMALRFIDGSSGDLGSVLLPVTDNGVTHAIRTLRCTLPANTRTISVQMVFHRESGTSNDGRIDDITLTAIDASAAVVYPTYMPVLNGMAILGTADWTQDTGNMGTSANGMGWPFGWVASIDTATSEQHQDIAVPASMQAKFDLGTMRARIEQSFDSFTDADTGAIELEWLNAGMSSLGTETGSHTTEDSFVNKTVTKVGITTLTRTLRLTMLGVRVTGTQLSAFPASMALWIDSPENHIITVDGLTTAQVVKSYGNLGVELESVTESGGSGLVEMDTDLLTEGKFFLVVYESDGTTPVAVNEDATLWTTDVWTLDQGPTPVDLTVTNSDFETGDETGWTPGAGQDPFVQGTVKRTGSYGLEMMSDISGFGERWQDVAVPAAQEGVVDTGTVTVRLIYWMRGHATQNDFASAKLSFYDGSPGSLISASQSLYRTWQGGADTTWVPRGQTITVPALTRTIRLHLQSNRHSGTTGDCWIDDVTLELVASAPDTPTITVPTIDAHSADMEGSTYVHTEGLDHIASQWQADTDSGFGSPDYDATDTYGAGAPSTPAHTAIDLLASTLYYFRVRYQDEDESWGGWSAGVSDTTDAGTAPTTPSVTATPSYDQVTLVGSALVDPVDPDRILVMAEWQVDESGGDYSTPVAESLEDITNLLSIILGGLTASTAYIARYRQRVDDGSWSAWSANESFTTTADPASKPDTPTASLESKTHISITLGGTAYNYPGETYTHEQTLAQASTSSSFPGGSTFQSSFTPGQVTELLVEGLSEDTLYYYRIRYKANNGVWSNWSATLNTTTNSDPLAGVLLAITSPRHGAVVRGSAVQVTWDPGSLGGVTFEIERSTDTDNWTSVATAISSSPYSWNTTALTDGWHTIRVRAGDGADDSPWEYRQVYVDNASNPNIFNTNRDEGDGNPEAAFTPLWNTAAHTWTFPGTVAFNEGSGLTSTGWAFLAYDPAFEPNQVDIACEVLNASTGGSFPWSWFPEQCYGGVGLFAAGTGTDAQDGIVAAFFALPINAIGDCWTGGRGDGFLVLEAFEAGTRILSANVPIGKIHFTKLFGGCSKIPYYGVRLRVTTIRRNGDGSRDMRLQASVQGMEIDTEAQDQWQLERVITTTLECGKAGYAAAENSTSRAYRSFTNLTVIPSEYGACDGPELPPTPLESCPAPALDFTIFDDTDLVPILGTADAEGNVIDPSFSTLGPGLHDRPHLKVWADGSQHEVDPIQGSSSVGAVSVEVLDFPTIVCDQRSGLITTVISDDEGFSALIGRRGVLRERLSDGTYQVVQDGPIYSVKLQGSMVTMLFSVRGPRERERNVPLFTNNETVSAWPAGPVEGYGHIGTVFGSLGIWLINPAEVGTGTVHYNGFGSLGTGFVQVDGATTDDYTDAMMTVGLAQPTLPATSEFVSFSYKYPHVTVKWRYPGDDDDSWRYVRNMIAPGIFGANAAINFWIVEGTPAFRFQFNPGLLPEFTGFGEVPPEGSTIQFQILVRVVSEDWPFYHEGPAGQFLKNIYDGLYSNADPNIGYDDTAMQDFIDNGPNVRLRKFEVEDDMRAWVEENVYSPFGWVPGLTDAGLIAPVSTAIPTSVSGLTTIDNTLAVSATWEQDGGRAVPIGRFKFVREYRAPLEVVDGEVGSSTIDWIAAEVARLAGVNDGVPYGIASEDVWIEYVGRSSALLTTKGVTFEPETVRSIGGDLGAAITGGDLFSEWAARMAFDRVKETVDRYQFGPEWVTLRVRDTPEMQALTVGQFALIDLDWLPNLATRYRGGQILGLVLRRKKDPGLAYEFSMLVIGAGQTGLTAPNIPDNTGGSGFDSGFDSGFGNEAGLTINEDLSATLCLTGEWFGWSSGFDSGFGDSGVTIRVQYAIGDTEPGANSQLWILLGLMTQSGCLTTEPLPAGTTVYFRARVERAGFLPSDWSNTVSEEVGPTQPVLYTLLSSIAQSGVPSIIWTESPPTLGLLVEYHVQSIGETPTYPNSVEIDAKNPGAGGFDSGFSAGFTNLSGVTRWYSLQTVTVDEGQQISFRVTPYTGWNGSIVSGTAGVPKLTSSQATGAAVASGFSTGFDNAAYGS